MAIGRVEPQSSEASGPRAAEPETPSALVASASAAADRPTGSAHLAWAHLLARIYEVLPLLCPACGGEMRILAFLADPPTVRGILSLPDDSDA